MNIIYKAGQEHLADICERSLFSRSPTLNVRRIDESDLDASLNNPSDLWILCCQADLFFWDSPLLLFEYVHPHKAVLKVSGYHISRSPITLWNQAKIPDITLRRIRDERIPENEIGDIPNCRVCDTQCSCPKAMLISYV